MQSREAMNEREQREVPPGCESVEGRPFADLAPSTFGVVPNGPNLPPERFLPIQVDAVARLRGLRLCRSGGRPTALVDQELVEEPTSVGCQLPAAGCAVEVQDAVHDTGLRQGGQGWVQQFRVA